MKINNIVITFWFNKVADIRNKIDTFEEELKEYFHGINSIGVPANITPDYPRLNAVSDGGHTKLNISMINLQLRTDFDDNYNKDYNLCFDYIKERAAKIFETLSTKLEFNILYSAIMAVCEIDNENPVNLIKDKLFSDKLSENYCEAGLRMTEIINNKFYKNIAINSTKQITVTKKIEPGQQEIIMPLISLAESKIEKESILINYEINDKYSFDSIKEYRLNSTNFNEMIDSAKKDIEEKILEIIE